MFVATSMTSGLVPVSVILFRVDPGQKSVGGSGGLIPILGRVMKKILCEGKNTTLQTDREALGNGEAERAKSTINQLGVEAPNERDQNRFPTVNQVNLFKSYNSEFKILSFQ
ncbi:hypothetical protein NPIL_374211 [Nephila pilipes]|uniref:Uncharacterized protein n=1 Tax=Nephila pilipes TaxID=299642 RepID=A0A8X6NZY9_NEPPI|nr:hypothetical protein NPIL_374211 [Nephila pilipes]